LFGEAARRHPVYKHAEKLLNETFRKEKLAQRAAVLKSAAWLITLGTAQRHRQGCPLLAQSERSDRTRLCPLTADKYKRRP
jgi:hypothetical protein